MAYTKEELIYIVGFFDGEGCVCSALRKGNTQLTMHLTITNTNKDQINWLQSKLGGSVTFAPRDNPNWKDSYYLQICGEEAARFVCDAIPISKVKKEQLYLALSYFATNGKKRSVEDNEFIFKSLKALNKRGK